jgi:hypothetical protein
MTLGNGDGDSLRRRPRRRHRQRRQRRWRRRSASPQSTATVGVVTATTTGYGDGGGDGLCRHRGDSDGRRLRRSRRRCHYRRLPLAWRRSRRHRRHHLRACGWVRRTGQRRKLGGAWRGTAGPDPSMRPFCNVPPRTQRERPLAQGRQCLCWPQRTAKWRGQIEQLEEWMAMKK